MIDAERKSYGRRITTAFESNKIDEWWALMQEVAALEKVPLCQVVKTFMIHFAEQQIAPFIERQTNYNFSYFTSILLISVLFLQMYIVMLHLR